MALIQEGESATYVSIFDGKFEVRVKEPISGSVVRVKKDGGEIHVVNYRGISGVIKDIKKETKDYKGQVFSSLKITLDDIGDKYILSMPYDSGLTSAFFHMMENVDLSTSVTFTASKGEDKNGKEKTSLFIAQEGVNLKWKYTKAWREANPTLPQKPDWEKILRKGKEEWDNTKELWFFEEILERVVMPKLRAEQPSPRKASEAQKFDDSDFPEGPTSSEPPATEWGGETAPPVQDDPF